MCLNKQDYEHVSGPKYTKILNMAEFSICQLFIALGIFQNMPGQSPEHILGSKYARTKRFSKRAGEASSILLVGRM